MIIDTHCHLHDAAFADVRATVREAIAHGVWGIVAVGSDAGSNERTLEAAAAWPRAVWPCLGLHPERTELGDEELERVEAQVGAHHARLVALGEVGLPWYALEGATDAAALMTRGRGRLGRVLRLAARYDLAVVVHAPHGAAVGALDALRHHGIERAVFHWHKAPPDVTRAIVEAGYHLSVTPEVVYRERDRELVASTPLGSLLIETDAPWAFGGEFTGLRSGPWLAGRVAEEVAKLKQMPVDDVVAQLNENACALFELPWA